MAFFPYSRQFLSSLISLSGLLAAAILSPSTALALDFSFEFDNVIGNVSGTVKGRILGLADTGTSAASQVFIDSAPAELGFTPPINVFSFYPIIETNSFEVSGGNIIAADFLARNSPNIPWFWINHSNGSDLNNFLGDEQNNLYVWNADGFSGVRFTNPVPGPLPIFGVAAAFGFSRKLRKRIKSSAIIGTSATSGQDCGWGR